MINKSLAFFDNGLAVPVTIPIFHGPQTRPRGRRKLSEKYFPSGELIPNREDLLQYILHNVLYQIDPVLGGPIFCKHVIKTHQDRNRETMYHVVLGPPTWTGVWEVIGNRRMFDVHAEYVTEEQGWVPQITVSPGNFIGVANLNGIELSEPQLHRELVERGFATEEEYEWFASPYASVRALATDKARPGIWM